MDPLDCPVIHCLAVAAWDDQADVEDPEEDLTCSRPVELEVGLRLLSPDSGSFSPYAQKWKSPQVTDGSENSCCIQFIPYLGCLRIFNDEVSSVLQLISRDATNSTMGR